MLLATTMCIFNSLYANHCFHLRRQKNLNLERRALIFTPNHQHFLHLLMPVDIAQRNPHTRVEDAMTAKQTMLYKCMARPIQCHNG